MRNCVFLLALLFSGALSAQNTLDIGIFNAPAGSNQLEIRVIPIQTVVNGLYSAGVFTIRFPMSYGVALVAPSNLNLSLFNYNQAIQGNDGIYQYYTFSFVSPYTVNWTAGVAYPIAIIQIVSGSSSGTGTFEIANNAWTSDHNADVYQELNGQAAQGSIYQPSTTVPLIPGDPDIIPPSISCTSNKTADTNPNTCTFTTIDDGWDAFGNDNYPGFTITYFFSGVSSGSALTLNNAIFNKGLTTVTAIIKDGANLADTCAFTVLVTDTQAPVITAPPPLNLQANAASCTADIALTPPQISDNCAVAQVSNNAPAHFPLGNTIVTWTVTDAAGLSASATQMVTVQSSLAATAVNLSNSIICNGGSSTLSFLLAGGVVPYHVTYNANGSSSTTGTYANNQPIIVMPALTTTYALVSVTDGIGCTLAPAGLMRTLIVKPTPTLGGLTPSAASVCLGVSVSVVADGLLPGTPTIFQYSLNGTPGNQTVTSTDEGTAVLLNTVFPADNYTLSVTSVVVAGCVATTSASATFAVDALSAICQLTLAGTIATETGQVVGDVAVNLSGAAGGGPGFNFSAITDMLGKFRFSDVVPPSANAMIVPYKNDNHLNGVSTFDLVLISKHILGLQILNSPYKIIAADANHSGLVTTSDIVELRKLILGYYDELPANTSWRFVPEGFVFPIPAEPFSAAFPEKITLNNLQTDLLDANFVAIKTGDVNDSVITGLISPAEERSTEILFFDVRAADLEKPLRAGQECTFHFKASERTAGFQFTLDLTGLEVLEIIPGPGMYADNFATFENAVTTSFFDEDGMGPMPSFSIRFRVKYGGIHHDIIRISSRITAAEAYTPTSDNTARKMDVQLRFGPDYSHEEVFEAYQNQPNPFSSATEIGFYTAEKEEVTISVYDEMGKMVFLKKQHFSAGTHKIEISGDALPAGILICKVNTPGHFAVIKMLKQ